MEFSNNFKFPLCSREANWVTSIHGQRKGWYGLGLSIVISSNGKIVSYTNVAKYTLVFYSDDFVVMCNTQKDAEDVYELLKPYLDKRGLELSKKKTRIVTIDEGFNFLGSNIRMYQTRQGEKLLIRPSEESIKKSKETISTEIQKLKGNNVSAVINKLNPIITGIGNYW